MVKSPQKPHTVFSNTLMRIGMIVRLLGNWCGLAPISMAKTPYFRFSNGAVVNQNFFCAANEHQQSKTLCKKLMLDAHSVISSVQLEFVGGTTSNLEKVAPLLSLR